MNDSKLYLTDYPTCTGCGLMFTAAGLHEGKCRDCLLINKMHIFNLIVWGLVLAAAALAIIFLGDDKPPLGHDTLSYHRCYSHGDWKETPYCTAAAQDIAG